MVKKTRISKMQKKILNCLSNTPREYISTSDIMAYVYPKTHKQKHEDELKIRTNKLKEYYDSIPDDEIKETQRERNKFISTNLSGSIQNYSLNSIKGGDVAKYRTKEISYGISCIKNMQKKTFQRSIQRSLKNLYLKRLILRSRNKQSFSRQKYKDGWGRRVHCYGWIINATAFHDT